MPFDCQAREEGYVPCSRGRFCEMELVRPGKVQCPCDDPNSPAAELKVLSDLIEESERRQWDD